MGRKKILEKRIQRLEQRKAELVQRGEASEDANEVRSINARISELNEDIEDVRMEIESLEAEERAAAGNGDPAADPGENEERNSGDEQEKRSLNPLGTYRSAAGDVEIRSENVEKYEQRGADLKDRKQIMVSMVETAEERAVNITAGTLVVPKHFSNTLSTTFNEVSSLIDRVEAVPLPGGNSYQKGFEKTWGIAAETAETADYNESDPDTDYVDINKAKITVYTEITDEAAKLPNVDYQALVSKNIRIALRKKITRDIITGAGGTNQLTGIFNAPTKVMPTADTEIEISAIDENTLDEIVFGYGGDEDVEGEAVLILNKKDLQAFSQVRGSDGHKLYEITMDRGGNTGTISSNGSLMVPWIINSVCPQLSDAATALDTKCMAYGKLMAYEMPIFSQVEIQESRDFKFKSGQIAFRGAVWAGGNVVSWKGFSVIKKVAAV